MPLSEPQSRKIFCIGLQKTGLTSLLRLMKAVGFDARGHNSAIRKAFFKRGDFDAVLAYYDTADFFCDWPTPLMYKLAFDKYGKDSLYILTVRKDARTWYESIKRHNQYAHPLKNKHRFVFGRYYPHGFDDEHIAYYEQHVAEVIRFFTDKGALDQLLVLRVDEPGSVSKVAGFLNLHIDQSAFPHANESRTDREGVGNRFKIKLNKLIHPIYAKYAPKLSSNPPRQFHPVDTSQTAQSDVK